MKKLSLIFFLLTLTTINIFSQEKKLLLRYDEISKSVGELEKGKWIEKGKTKTLGTILVYSKKVMFYDEEKKTFETFEINEVVKERGKEFLVSKTENKSYVFNLTKDKKYFTQVGKKDRFVYRIINYKYAEE